MQEMKGSQETKDFPVLDSRTSVLHVCNHYVPQFLLCNPYVSRARCITPLVLILVDLTPHDSNVVY